MKIRWKHFRIFLTVALLTVAFAAGAQKRNAPKDPHARIAELDDLTFIEMVNSVGPNNVKEADLLKRFQTQEGKKLRGMNRFNAKSGNNVEMFRNSEVILITIPADKLFGPNSTELLPEAVKYLEPMRRYLKEGDMFRVLLTMHTDNTGSEAYRDEITIDRVNSVFDWFEDQNISTTYLFPYAMSDEMPLKDNDTMENRRNNRRLEIYLVPGKKMVDAAKKGRIEF